MFPCRPMDLYTPMITPYSLRRVSWSELYRSVNACLQLQKVRPTNAYLWNWGTVVWTSAVFLLCPACAYFTLGALLCNIFAYVDHKVSLQSHQSCSAEQEATSKITRQGKSRKKNRIFCVDRKARNASKTAWLNMLDTLLPSPNVCRLFGVNMIYIRYWIK